MSTHTQPPHASETDDDFTVLPAERADRSHVSQFPKRLTILGLIDQGGIGRVHLAYDEIIGRRVAVKELLEEYSGKSEAEIEVANTFIHEAKITGKLEHPGIIPVYELGRRSDGQPYYVMRYVKGETLEKSLKKCVDGESESAFVRRLKLLDTLITVCETVGYAHSKGVIHRDLKPANIIKGSFGETIVLDWGLAQVLDDKDNTYFYREVLTHQSHTLSDQSTSEILGTPAYMAPEQFNGIASKASDVYSLGAILYRLLTGTTPYKGSLTEIQSQATSLKASPSVRQLNPSAPPELIAICEKAMHKQAEERFADAGEMATQLKAFRDGRMVNIYAYSKQELLRRFLQQNKTMVVMVGLLMLAILAGAGFSIYYAKQMEAAKTEAESALVVLTAFGERSQQQARSIAAALSDSSARLFSDLKRVATQIDISNPQPTEQLLTQLQQKYPKFEAFTLRNPDEIATAFSKDSKDYAQQILRPIAKMDNKRLMLIFRIPVPQESQPVAYIEAHLYPEKVLPDFLPLDTQQDTHRRNVWIMRNDGLIVFDESPQYIGTNLFTDPINYRSASLQAFGRMMLTENDSIGYYSIVDGSTETDKIAAWDSVDFGGGHSWKIVVSYAYLQKSTAAPLDLPDIID